MKNKLINVKFMTSFKADSSEYNFQEESVEEIKLPEYIFEHLDKLFLKPNDDLSLKLESTFYCNHCHQKLKYTAETFGPGWSRGSTWECQCGSWHAGSGEFGKPRKENTMIPKYKKFTADELERAKEYCHKRVNEYFESVSQGKPSDYDTPIELI